MVEVMATQHHRIMQYGHLLPLRSTTTTTDTTTEPTAPAPAPDRHGMARQALGKRVREHLFNTHALDTRNNRVELNSGSDLEFIQRRLAQQLEEKQKRLKETIRHQENELTALRSQLESQPNLQDNPIMKVHLTILHKLEMKRAKQERMLFDLKSAYEAQRKSSPAPVDRTSLAHCSPTSTISSPPSESSDTDSSSNTQHNVSPVFQMPTPIFEEPVQMKFGRQVSMGNCPNMPLRDPSQQGTKPENGSMSLMNGISAVKPQPHVKPQWTGTEAFYRDIPPVTQSPRFPVLGAPGHPREQAMGPGNGNSFMMPNSQLPHQHMFNQGKITGPTPHSQSLPVNQQFPAPHSQSLPINQQFPATSPAHPPFPERQPYLRAPSEGIHYQTQSPMERMHQRQQDGPQASMKPPSVRGQPLGREFPPTGSQGDGLDYVTATLPGLESDQNARSLLVDSVLGMDTEEFGQYMGPASSWIMAQMQGPNFYGNTTSQGPTMLPVTGQGGQAQEERQVTPSQNNSYSWL